VSSLVLVGAANRLMQTSGQALETASIQVGGQTLTGTVAVTNGSPDITFTDGQTLPEGAVIVFEEQPDDEYVLAAALTGGTAGVLTENYTGTTAGATTAIVPGYSFASVTVSVTEGSPDITFSSAATLPAGTQLTFSSQPDETYTLADAMASETDGVLTGPYTGPTNAAATPSNVTPVLTCSQETVIDVVGTNGQQLRFQTVPFGTVSPGLGQVLATPTDGVFNLVGTDRQPVQVSSVPASSLVP
jgi:hypothetical protein